MSFDDKLQRQFDSAESVIEFESGSARAIRETAIRRNRTRRIVLSAAVLAVIVGLGVFFVRMPSNNDAVDLEVASPPELDDGNETTGSLSGDLLTDADFTYLGAFRLPAGDWGESRFAFGGEAATFFAGGDPESDDGYGGSLFVSGHPTRNPGVAEVTIPEPALHDGSTENLPIAKVLRPFTDITGGLGATVVGGTEVGGTGERDSFRFSGLEVIPTAQGDRLAWTIYQTQNSTRNVVPGHGHSSVDLRDPSPQGPWFLGEFDSQSTAGYLFDVPEDLASEHLGGRRIVTGLQDRNGSGDRSFGPPFFAFNAPDTAEPNDRVDVLPLAFYDGEPQSLEGFGLADAAGGAEWVTTPTGSQAVITVGSRGLGEVRFGPPGPDDCGPDQATHAGPYEPLVMFYDPADLARLASGELEPWQLEPYLRWNPAELLTPTCDWRLTAVSFDEVNRRLYIVQSGADLAQSEFSPIPVVHVFDL